MLQRFSHALLALLAAAPLAQAAGGEGWLADFDAAVTAAKAEKKDLLVDFTGSDWCGWCKRLDAEVFKHEAFLTPAKKDFVLVALDFPRGEEAKAKVPNPKRNDELQAKYGVQGFPTIMLLTADGLVLGQMSYQPGGPEKFVADMSAIRTKAHAELGAYRALVETWTKAQGEDKFKAWDALAARLIQDGGESSVAKLMIEPVRTGLAFDAEKQAARRLKAVEALLVGGEQDQALIDLASQLDPKNEAGVLERGVAAVFKQINDLEAMKAALAKLDALVALGARKHKELDFDLHANAAYFCAQHLNEPERAKAYAKTAKQIGSDNPRAMEFIEGILGS